MNKDSQKTNLGKEHSSEQEENPNPKSDILELMLGAKKTQVVDSETMIKETQKRIWNSIKKGVEYEATFDESDRFLRKHVSERLNIIALYVDLVGSTDLTLQLPPKKIATIISSFTQEMAFVIMHHNGYVLKFVGDSVLGYFVTGENSLLAADSAVNCAKSMMSVVSDGINPILNEYDYPDLIIKIGIDYGESVVVRYGATTVESHIDLLGPAMSIASKIQDHAKPNQILIGEDVYTRLHPTLKKSFKEVQWKENEWRFHDRETGKLYPVFSFVRQ